VFCVGRERYLSVAEVVSAGSRVVRSVLVSASRRHQVLAGEIADLDAQLRLVKTGLPGADHHPRSFETAACSSPLATTPTGSAPLGRLRRICGVAAIPASSGKTRRDRRSRCGGWQADRAVHMVACTGLATCSRKLRLPRTGAPRTVAPQRPPARPCARSTKPLPGKTSPIPNFQRRLDNHRSIGGFITQRISRMFVESPCSSQNGARLWGVQFELRFGDSGDPC